MKLGSELHCRLSDLLECHSAVRSDRVRRTLIDAMARYLAESFDPSEVYARYSLAINADVLTFTCHVSLDGEDETEHDEDDKYYVINVRTGRYYVE